MQVAPVARIPLRARDGSVKAWALVDATDYKWLSRWRWCDSGNGYAMAREYWPGNRYGKRLSMHRLILGLEDGNGQEVDHINRDKLDNRRANLRVVDRFEQMHNLPAWGRSRHRGVTFHKPTGRWTATVNVRKKRHLLGYFDDEDEAGRVAAEKRAELMSHAVEVTA